MRSQNNQDQNASHQKTLKRRLNYSMQRGQLIWRRERRKTCDDFANIKEHY